MNTVHRKAVAGAVVGILIALALALLWPSVAVLIAMPAFLTCVFLAATPDGPGRQRRATDRFRITGS